MTFYFMDVFQGSFLSEKFWTTTFAKVEIISSFHVCLYLHH